MIARVWEIDFNQNPEHLDEKQVVVIQSITC